MTQTLLIQPDRFIASAGKLDSNNLYFYPIGSSGRFCFAQGQTSFVDYDCLSIDGFVNGYPPSAWDIPVPGSKRMVEI